MRFTKPVVIAGFATLAAIGTLFVLQTPLSSSQGQTFLQTFDAVDAKYAQYMAKHNKIHKTKEEYIFRRGIFEQSLKFIEQHNSRPDVSSTVDINFFCDLTTEEIEKFLGDSGEPEVDNQYESQEQLPTSNDTPVPIDWRDAGIVGPVKNQGDCGSCWSFSTNGPIEEHYMKKYGQAIVLSEQQLVDCSWPFGNNGCGGGLYANGYAYAKQFGVMSNQSYPYIDKDQSCNYDASKVIVKVQGTVAALRNPDGLKQALMVGPASISLHAKFGPFLLYSGGIFDYPNCPTNVDHAVHTVGWGRETNQATGVTKDYFIIRNSWGPTWGEQGYMRIAQTNTTLGNCGMFYRIPMQPIIA